MASTFAQSILAQAIEELRKPGPRPPVRGSGRIARSPFQIMRSAVSYTSPVIQHADLIKSVLADEQILHDNSLATVTTNFIVVRRPERRRETIIALPRLSRIRRIEISHPGLVVIASAIYLLAAAAYCSKEGGQQVAVTMAILGTLFVFGYFMTRRAAVAFVVDREPTETIHGSLREAAQLMKAMAKAREELGSAS